MEKPLLPFGWRRGAGAADAGKDVTAEFVGAAAAPMTVSALAAGIKDALLEAFPAPVAVVGEVSNFKRHTSGHLYFSLKDERATIDAVMFRTDAASVRFEIADGLEVVAEGRVDVYEKQGRLQLYVRRLLPKGTGALELAFRQLKERLETEGLFETSRKQPIARFPRAVGVVTSPTGAAVRDIARTLARRWPAAGVYLVGVRVQGESAAGEVAEAIGLLDTAAGRLGIDTIIVARGGGSLEDLWAFNEEVVARAIFAARTPVISGVGHEVDFTIADFVADVRAATPTAAAELAVPDGGEVRRHVVALAGRLGRRPREMLQAGRSALAAVQRSAVFRDPAAGVRSGRQELDGLTSRMRQALQAVLRTREQRLHQAERKLAALHPRRLLETALARLNRAGGDMAWALGRRAKRAGDAVIAAYLRLTGVHPRHRLKLGRQRVDGLERHLEAMSYRAPLKRGYSVTRIKGGKILRVAAGVRPGEALETELADGKIESQVGGVRPPAGSRRPKSDTRTPTLFGDEEQQP